jgi:cation diffusion facilitator CzcD-associated flavoprotein CzcO
MSEDQKESRNLVADIMREQLDNDSILTKKIIPTFDLGCRRMTPGPGYLQSLKKDNVHVVTESVVKFTKDGVVDESGTEHKVDVVICATGFDVSFAPHFEVIGRDGANIKEQFGECPKAYLSITAPNFPNLFCTFNLDSHPSPLKLIHHSVHRTKRACKPQLHPSNSGMAYKISFPNGGEATDRKHQSF